MLDAGSSRTTVYVYQWPAEKENNTGVVSQTFKCSVKGKAQSVCRRPIGKQGRILRAFRGLEGSREAAWRQGMSTGLGIRNICDLVLVLLLIHAVTSGHSLPFSGLQFPHV